ncbi:MAG: gamma-D-glutamyl-meso-diaminopimelate peptidase, partial [Ruminococcus sp.]
KTSGYTLSAPPDIADGGGLKDWFIQRFHRPGFTFEIGMGINPLPLSDLEVEYKILQKALCLAVIV